MKQQARVLVRGGFIPYVAFEPFRRQFGTLFGIVTSFYGIFPILSEWPTLLPSPLTHPTIMVPLKSEYFLHLAVVDVRRSIFGVGVGDQTVFLRIRSTSTHNNNSCSNWLFYEFEPNLKLPTVGSIMIRVSQVSELRLERREGSVRIRFSQISTSRPFTSVLSVSLCFPAVGALPNPGHGVGHSCEDP